MSSELSVQTFYQTLLNGLPGSSMAQRRQWVHTLIENNVAIHDLTPLLLGEQRIALRFLWFLTEVGQKHPNKLLCELPYLYEFMRNLNPIYKQSLASFWLIAGVPPENESDAIEYMYALLQSGETNVTVKSRAMMVLFQLTEKYPELKHELYSCLEEQAMLYSKDFEKRVNKVIMKLKKGN